jgi:hypothetical protein
MAASETGKEAVHLGGLADELGESADGPMELFVPWISDSFVVHQPT